MNFDSNNFQFTPDQFSLIEQKLECDGYVRIQFSVDHLPAGNDQIKQIESFFVDIITKLGGQCLTHNGNQNSIVLHEKSLQSVSK